MRHSADIVLFIYIFYCVFSCVGLQSDYHITLFNIRRGFKIFVVFFMDARPSKVLRSVITITCNICTQLYILVQDIVHM